MPSLPKSSQSSILLEQLQSQRRKVDFDTFDILLQQLINMINDGQITVAPSYQRQFRWDNMRCSQLIESVFLGIPVPSLFMATNEDGTWELVDGVQRVSAIVKFAGCEELRKKLGLKDPLSLEGLEKLESFNGCAFQDLPQSIRLQFLNRSLKVVTLSDKSDDIVRFDLFERLNRGGVSLTDQEIRDCVFRGPFANLLETLAKDDNFRKVVKLTASQDQDGTREECVLRFFAFLENYKNFVHSVRDFLNDYMRSASKKFDLVNGERVFRSTFAKLAKALPNGISRPGIGKRTTTPLNLFEGVSVGAALALKSKKVLSHKDTNWLGAEELKTFTTGATNNLSAVRGRIEFCRDKFLGK